jgi:mRNA-degrading endonuclease RelE of RelBE toxin-antitoxin system
LPGDLAGQYRMRTGDYRMQFFVETTTLPPASKGAKPTKQNTVLVFKVGHRDGLYDD